MLRSNTAERLRALTHALVFGMVEAPNKARRSRRLCRAPHGEKSGLFRFVSIPATGVSCERRYISTGHVQYPRGLAALLWPGSVSRLFLCLQSLKQSRCFMYSIPLFRPASCGGRASLSFLLRKLARAGELLPLAYDRMGLSGNARAFVADGLSGAIMGQIWDVERSLVETGDRAEASALGLLRLARGLDQQEVRE